MPFDHMSAILAGLVSRTTVIGLRKAINADERRARGYSTSSTCPTLTGDDITALELALAKHEPLVTPDLFESGDKLLHSPRYRKRLESVQGIIDTLESFHLVAYARIGTGWGLPHAVPIYKAKGASGWFLFRNVPWQSGGDGPEVLKVQHG